MTEETSSITCIATPCAIKCDLFLVAAQTHYGNPPSYFFLSSSLFISNACFRSMRDTPTGEKFNFSGKTLIEDTETSHAFMEQGETSTYISKGLVHGSVKNPEDYGEAPSRWAAGAIQLLFRQPSAFRYILSSLFFYVVLPLLASLIVVCVRHGEWVLLAAWCAGLLISLVWACTSSHKRRAAQAVIRMVNTTYWITGPLTAVFWMLIVPTYILLSGQLPFQFNAEAMMSGGLLTSVLQVCPSPHFSSLLPI